MAKNAEKSAAKRQTRTKQDSGKRADETKRAKVAPQSAARFKALEEATKLAIKVHRRALKELEKH